MRLFHSLPIILTGSMFGLSGNGQAQTYFYIDQITVVPASPSDQDNVQLELSGNLSSSDSFVDTAFATVNGFAVTLMVNANTSGGIGIPVLVPHTETLHIGQLTAGTYSISVAGSGVDDSAPSAQHSFTVTGGTSTVCDSLILASVSWAPFSDTALLVHAFNPTSELFDYPSFILLDANGDTLAKETVFYFGIGAESWHTLSLQPGAVIPDGPFTGTLELWTLFGQQLACSWSRSFDLCPQTPCAPLTASIQNNGGALAIGTFQYTIRHLGDLVANGTFELTADAQYDSDSLCLPPGNYLMEVVADQAPSGGQPFFGVSLGNGVQGPSAPVIVTTLSAVAFNFYEACAEGTQGIVERPADELTIAYGKGMVSVERTDGKPLGQLSVYDAHGRLLARLDERTGRHQFATSSWASGLYVLQSLGGNQRPLTARWVVE
jgi:hypothetical protein